MSHIGDPSHKVVALKATAVSEGDKLFVSVVNDEVSYGSGTPKIQETLTFFGDYDIEHKPLTDLEKFELEKKREANGVLTFKEGLFVAEDFTKFKVTKVENLLKHNYDVTIGFTGVRKVGMSQISISAEFKGEGDIRVGEGAGHWRMAVKNPNN